MMAVPLRLYHNPRCTKSREAKKILDDKGVEYETVLYLEDPPSLAQLEKIAEHVDGGAASLLRMKEAREEGWDPQGEVSDQKVLEFIAEHPRALQRPIVTRGDAAVVGRPPQQIQRFL